MNRRIFRSSMAVALFVCLSTIILIMGVLFDFYEKQLLKELKSEANYIVCAIEDSGYDYIDHFKGDDKRITVIAPDGTVTADTTADISKLKNHSDREEFKEASETGVGSSVRYSATLMEKTVYFAKKMSDGNILRVCATQYSAAAVILTFIQPILVIFLLAIIISLFLSRRVSRSIIEPINSLDLENPLNNDTYEELAPLLNEIYSNKCTIDKQIEEAKKRQEEFRLITENMDEGFLVVDKQTNLLTYNQSALRLLGADKVNEGSALVLNRTRNFREVMEKALAGERAESDMSVNERVYSLIASPVIDNEDVIGAVIVILDVTERAKNEQIRREFTSNVSHELKTPLTSISGFAELMKSGDVPSDVVTDFSASIYCEAQRLITLVNDIIKISELDEGNALPESECVDVYEVSEQIIERLAPQAKKKNIKMKLTGTTANVRGVRKIIDEMISNLCDNAIKYNRENGSVDVVIESDEARVNVTVQDTGIGIPPASRTRVFERFYRVDKSHSKEIGGTGLGLAIVKHGAMYHDALLTLDSTEGKGTSITISFHKYKNT